MITDVFWKRTNGKEHITAGTTKWPEGFNVLEELKKMFLSETNIAEFGCGYGRLATAFDPDKYHGFDINQNAINTAKEENHQYRFSVIDKPEEICFAGAILAYTVLLHISDEDINYCVSSLCGRAPRIIVSEILGRYWRKKGTVPVFNRDLGDYEAIFKNNGFMLHNKIERDYKHYRDTKISFLDFRIME